jgi:hypothetical protein
MKANEKLRAGPEDITKFKLMWRDTMSEREKDYWRELFVSPRMSQPQIRRHLFDKLKINLRYNRQLNRFRDWEAEQREMDWIQEKAEEDEERVLKEHPEWTKDDVRADLLKRFYYRARTRGDAKLGLRTVAADVRVGSLELDWAKFEFDATKAAMGKLESLKRIKANSRLSEDEKIQRAREELFGEGAAAQ